MCIQTRGYLANAGYDKIHHRTFGTSIVPHQHGDWDPESTPFQLLIPNLGAIAYSGAEHYGTPKLPNITVVPNWQTQERDGSPSLRMMMGSTMGHYHPPDPSGRRTQEVYQFCTPGLLVLDHEHGDSQIWVAKEGDKVAVPDACHMTLYNLGEAQQPLITLDFADPARNPSDKTLIAACGPILLIYYDSFEVTFVLNRTYINNPTFPVGVRLGCTPTLAERSITIPRAGRMDLGSFLYTQLTGNPTVIGQFARLGLHLIPASPQATLEPVDGASDRRLTFTRPLVQAAVSGSEVYTYFMPHATPADTAPRLKIDGEAFCQALARKAATVHKRTALQALNRPLVLLVQGAGDWVVKAFRPAFTAL